ncbi:UNVERIFIED_CONTAM: hypothetical protein GTU68_007459 [Idotea baltica]|nr:hypothetical protein [Idotea baltica]
MLEADYLIIGSGAVGMAFADVLITESNATVIIVDRYAMPGGHWNVAYPFVTLHQPSNFYGVSSKELSNGRTYESGLNKGLLSLATGSEIQGYFNDVMELQLLPSGRVQYFPLCNYTGDGKFESILTGESYAVQVRKKIVDATYLNTSVPSTHTPNFDIDPEVWFMPLNDLPKIKTIPDRYVVIGGGKTGIDACLWLLQYGIDPDKITWIISRDAWLLDRANVQPTDEHFTSTIGSQAAQIEAIAASTSIPDMFDKLEAAGVFLRLDESVRPKMFHGATVSKLELEQLRRIKNVVRKGRVSKIEKSRILFDEEFISTSPNTVHIDCSATPISNIDTKPIFQGNVITPQTVRSYQPIFSAAFTAFIELNWDKEEDKNKLCKPVRPPNHVIDWPLMMLEAMENQFVWSQQKKIGKWLYNNRLDGFSKLVRDASRDDKEKQSIINRLRQGSLPAMLKLMEYSKEIEGRKEVLERPQYEIQKNLFLKGQLNNVPQEELALDEGDILVKVDKFAYTANNITYAVAGDMLGYWQFFPVKDATKSLGVIPVWGFADVIESKGSQLQVGERLFGYFPPAKFLRMTPSMISNQQFVEGAAHRKHLPQGYNLYKRVHAESDYNSKLDDTRALLYPLYLTSYCIWDALQEADYYNASQVIILSASSKTSIGVAYALNNAPNSPTVIGMTSKRNLEMVSNLGMYDTVLSYDYIENIDITKSTLIVDMSGNGVLMGKLHTQLGDQMKHTMFVGYTHWMNAQKKTGIKKERISRFFVPMHAQERIKEWGISEFNKRTNDFINDAVRKSSSWLSIRTLKGLENLDEIHPQVCIGQANPKEGIIIKV